MFHFSVKNRPPFTFYPSPTFNLLCDVNHLSVENRPHLLHSWSVGIVCFAGRLSGGRTLMLLIVWAHHPLLYW